jgi:hypothetical protein
LRQVTRAGYITSAWNPSAHNRRLAATSAYTSPFFSPYFTFTTSPLSEIALEFRRRAAERLRGKDKRARDVRGDALRGGHDRALDEIQRRCVQRPPDVGALHYLLPLGDAQLLERVRTFGRLGVGRRAVAPTGASTESQCDQADRQRASHHRRPIDSLRDRHSIVKVMLGIL